MTKDEILQMPAGRELDALVAEKVFGWVPKSVKGKVYGNLWIDLDEKIRLIPSPYSTDISIAFNVVFQMRRSGFVSQCSDLTMDSNGEWWHWKFYDYMSKQDKKYDAYGTIPVAICRAALLAVAEVAT